MAEQEEVRGRNRHISGDYVLRKVLHMQRMGIPARLKQTKFGAAAVPDWKIADDKTRTDA